MKIYLIHGNDLISTEDKFLNLRKELSDYEVTQREFNDIQDLTHEISTQSLFSDQRLLIITDPAESWDLSQITGNDSTILLLVVKKELPSSSKLFKSIQGKATVFLYSEREKTTIFPFLDSLIERKQTAYKDLDILHKEYGSQYIITMMYFSLRKLILPIKSTSSFARDKITRQKKLWTTEEIKSFYGKILQTDFKIKSGVIEEKIGLNAIVAEFIY